MDTDEFRTKASEAAKEEATSKVEDLEAEIRNFEGTIAQFEKLKLEN